MHRLDLAGGDWWLERADRPPGRRAECVPATVPGCVHLDLEAAGRVPAIDDGDAEERLEWIGRTSWRYRRRFAFDGAWRGAERIDLVLDGLDTAACVSVNGARHGRVANEFHPHRFDLRWSLSESGNELAIDFEAPLECAERAARRLGRRPVNGDGGPYAYLRKAACDFGWDWGPRVRTSGVRTGAVVEAWSVARIAQVRPIVRRADAERAVVDVTVDVEHALVPRACTVRIDLCGHTASVTAGDTARFEIDAPELWWPRGLGTPVLHALEVVLIHNGVELHRATRAIGLRTVTLETGSDRDGSAFRVCVNDRAIFCRGANVVPGHAVRGDDGRAEAIVSDAVAAEMNMLRVWGGGRYERDAFYAACDRAGVLVWQDFMLACASYPEEPPYPQRLAREARHQVARLAGHPSVALYCGANEVEVAMRCWEDFGHRQPPDVGWGRAYLYGLLPGIVRELDPSRPYWPDSPSSPAPSVDPNDVRHGDCHVWNHAFEGYRAIVPRFVSEFGQQAPPGRRAIGCAIGHPMTEFRCAELERRQRATGGFERWYGAALREQFGGTDDAALTHWRAQLLQARALRIACTWWRANADTCGGVLVWQHNDVWTGHSWSLLDVTLQRKTAWYAVRAAFAPRMVCMHPNADGGATTFVVDDEGQGGAVAVRRVDADGRVLAAAAAPISGPSTRFVLPEAVATPVHPERELIVADAGPVRAVQAFKHDRDLDFPAPVFDVAISPSAYGCAVAVRAHTVVRDLTLETDQLAADARTNSGLVTLLPGEMHEFDVQCSDVPDPETVRAALRYA